MLGLLFGDLEPSVPVAIGNGAHAAWQDLVSSYEREIVERIPLTEEGQARATAAKRRHQLLFALCGDARFRDEVHARALEDWPVELILRASPPPRRIPRLGGPVLSLLCDAQGALPDEIERLIRSVREQTYPRWELCLRDSEDAPTLTKYAVDRHRGSDPRLRFLRTSEPHTRAMAVNRAAELLTGDYVGVVGAADELTPEALAYVVQALAEHPSAEVLYSDEEVRTSMGGEVIRKPDWSPDLQTCRPYLGRLTLVRTELWLELGGLDARHPGAEEDALALQATGRAALVVHVPEVTCRRDLRPADPAALAAAVTAFVRRTDGDARVSKGLVPGSFRVDWASPPSRGDVTVVVVGYVLDAELAALKERGQAAGRRNIQCVPTSAADGAGLNDALAEVSTEDVVFLHAGAPALADDWVEMLTGHARRLGVGLAAACVGADVPSTAGESLASAALVRNDATPGWPGAVAARRSVLCWMGGFDASHDVGAALADLSVRLRTQGFRTVQTPFTNARRKSASTL